MIFKDISTFKYNIYNISKMNRTDTILTLNIVNRDIEKYNEIESIFQDASVIQYGKCSFIYDKPGEFYHPVEGVSMGVDFAIKELNFTELIEILDKKMINLVYYRYYDVKSVILQDLAVDLNYITRIDYIGTLNFLEKRDMVDIKESKSFLATDNRVFSFKGDDDWVEVDIIGTPFGETHTNKLIDLYNECK